MICWLLLVARSDGKPTELRPRVHQEEPLSTLRHDDKQNFDYDHEAFLGQDEAKAFDRLSPGESKRRLRSVWRFSFSLTFPAADWPWRRPEVGCSWVWVP